MRRKEQKEVHAIKMLSNEREMNKHTLWTNGNQLETLILQELEGNTHILQLLVVELDDLGVLWEPLC